MKITLRWIMAALVLLLMAAPMANAQSSGALSGNGAGLTYSFTGGTVTSHGDSHPGRQRGYNCEVTPGTTITFQCQASGKYKNGKFRKIGRASIEAGVSYDALYHGNRLYHEVKNDVNTAAFSYTVPEEAGYVSIKANVDTGETLPLSISVGFKVVKGKPAPKSDPKPAPDPKAQSKYKYCFCNGDRIDSKIRFNDLCGEVKIRPDWLKDNAYEFAEFETIIYECDRIKTEEESEAVLGFENMSTYVVKPESIVIIHNKDGNVNKWELVLGAFWANIKRTLEGDSIEVEMSQGVAGIEGTIFACEEKDGASKFWLFAGRVSFTNKKTGKKTVLQPGQCITCKGSSSNVQSFNIEQGAKKFGIKMSDINNHYSNTNTKPNNTGNANTSTTTGKSTNKSSQEIEDGVYIIRFSHDPVYVLTLKDGKAVNDNIVHLWKNQNTNAQKWKVTHEKGKIAIRSMVDPTYALDVKSFNYSNNAEIILYKYHGGDNQLWVPERINERSHILKIAGNPSFCLDLFEGRAVNGGVVELYNAHKLWPEWWTFEKVK